MKGGLFPTQVVSVHYLPNRKRGIIHEPEYRTYPEASRLSELHRPARTRNFRRQHFVYHYRRQANSVPLWNVQRNPSPRDCRTFQNVLHRRN